jgi:hypothetical protein
VGKATAAGPELTSLREEVERQARRLKVCEDFVRKLFAGIPGGSTRVAAYDEALRYAQQKPIIYEVGEPVTYKPWNSGGELIEWNQAAGYGTVKLHTGERLQAEASEIEKGAA